MPLMFMTVAHNYFDAHDVCMVHVGMVNATTVYLDHRTPRILRSFLADFLTFMFFGMLVNLGHSKTITIGLSQSIAPCTYT